MPLPLRIVLFLLLSGLLFSPSGLSAPKHTPGATSLSAYKLTAIKVTGTKRYTPEEIIAASGLRIGEEVTEQNFKEASQKLGDTGAFTEITYTYSYSSEGTKLEIQVTDNDQLIPVHFDNFVWFSDQELLQELREYVPLFKNRLPLGGPLADELSDALEAMLARRGIAGHAHYMRATSSEGGPIDSVIYTVTGPDITIRHVEFPGASPAQVAALQEAARKEIEGGDYLRSKLAIVANLALRPIYLKQGYLKASFGEAQAQVVSSSPKETTVDVKLPVEEGVQYKLAKIGWTGNTVFPAEKLQPLVRLPVNQPVNAVQLDEDLQAVKRLYGSRGYVKAAFLPQPEFHEGENTVSYTIQVKEGDVYRMGDFEIVGLDDKAAARLHDDWRLREGEPYDSSYPKRFLEESARDFPSGVQWKISIHESVNDKDKTVDVTINFAPG